MCENNQFKDNVLEQQVYNILLKGEVANGKDLLAVGSAVELMPEEYPEIQSNFIRKLVTCEKCLGEFQKNKTRIRLEHFKITGAMDLEGLSVPFTVSLRKCKIPEPINLQKAIFMELDLSGSETGIIGADNLTVNGDLILEKGFSASGPVSLASALIEGNLRCGGSSFAVDKKLDYVPGNNCHDCRKRLMNSYSIILERIHVKKSVYLCGGFKATGGVFLGDSIIEGVLNCTKGKFISCYHEQKEIQKKYNGRRLTCESNHQEHCACAFNCEGMQVNGSVLLKEITAIGEVRLTGAKVEGDLDSAGGDYNNCASNAIYGDRLKVNGNVFFCDEFVAKGSVRLPRSTIGADLSFFKSEFSSSAHNSAGIFCKGIKVNGAVYFKNMTTHGCYIDISSSFIGGDLNCTGSKFGESNSRSLCATGMSIKGDVLLSDDDIESKGFKAEGHVDLSGSKIENDLKCTNGQFVSQGISQDGKEFIGAINAKNMLIGGKVEMNGKKFIAKGGIAIDDTRIDSYFDCKGGTFTSISDGSLMNNYSISAGKLHVHGSVYLSDNFVSNGLVMLNDSQIGRNLNCDGGMFNNRCKISIWADQIKVTGSINLSEGFRSCGKIKMNRIEIGGSLDCSKGKLNCEGDGSDEKKYLTRDVEALEVIGGKIEGSAKFVEFQAVGMIMLERSAIKGVFLWRNIINPSSIILNLDSVKVGVLDDMNKENEWWPEKEKLFVNGFEYQSLESLEANQLKVRCDKWLSLTRDYRSQPYEHLASILRRCGYEDEAKRVLIKKNDRQLKLKLTKEHKDIVGFLKMFFLRALISYGYRPVQSFFIGFVFLVIGWFVFGWAFEHKLMVPTKNGEYVFQTTTITLQKPELEESKKKGFGNLPALIEGYRTLYYGLYALDTFLPIVDFNIACHWLPTAYSYEIEGNKVKKKAADVKGVAICLYRIFLIAIGWVTTTLIIASWTGIVGSRSR